MKKIMGICIALGTLFGSEASAEIHSNMKVSKAGTEITVNFKGYPQVGAVSLSFIHLAKTGDTLWSISRKYGLTVEELAKVNRLDPNRILMLNQRIIIPVKPKLEGKPVAQKNPSVKVYVVVDEKQAQETAKKPQHVGQYEVKQGDTLYSIAKRYKVTVQQLAQVNGLTSHEELRYGTRLNVPQYSEYVVQSGDTLHQIARKHGTSVQALSQLNYLKEKNSLSVGQRLKIPL